jgi:hypothetical protein
VAVTIRNVEALCREYFSPTKADLQTINDHVIQCDSLKMLRMMGDKKLDGYTLNVLVFDGGLYERLQKWKEGFV